MSTKDINDLFDRYDKLRSVSNSGSSDKSISSRSKILRRIFEYKLLKNFSINTYVVPYAFNHARKEIRSTLFHILKLHEINYLRTGRSDKSSKEAIDSIKEYLNEMPKRGLSFLDRLQNNSLNMIAIAIGIMPIIISIWSPAIKVILIVGGLTVLLLFVPPYLIQKVTWYLMERRWHKDWMKKLAIDDLKQKIIKELVELNDRTYTELDTKYKDS